VATKGRSQSAPGTLTPKVTVQRSGTVALDPLLKQWDHKTWFWLGSNFIGNPPGCS
jgi:hypothetical protein